MPAYAVCHTAAEPRHNWTRNGLECSAGDGLPVQPSHALECAVSTCRLRLGGPLALSVGEHPQLGFALVADRIAPLRFGRLRCAGCFLRGALLVAHSVLLSPCSFPPV